MALPKQEEHFSYAELLAWEDGKRYELYDGEVVALASPSAAHQSTSMELSRQFATFLLGKPCQVFAAPFDVRLFEQAGDAPEDVDTVVQPDLVVVCDPASLDQRGVHGAPALVVEILSVSTAEYDWRTKFELYQRAGVREYWIVDPIARFAAVHILRDGKYDTPIFYTAGARVPVSLWEGFGVDLSTVFPA